jgi:hypothetical protein
MGKLSDWASAQGSGQPSTSYEKGVYYPWSVLLSNPVAAPESADWSASRDWFGSSADGTFNVTDIVYRESSGVGGSPYESVTAYNPDSLIAEIEDAMDEMENAISDFEDDLLDESAQQATEIYQTILGDNSIDDLVDAFRVRQDSAYLRDVSTLYAGLWEYGAIVGTQTFIGAALLKNENNRAVTEYEKNLRVNHESMRMQMIGNLVNTAVGIATQRMQARQAMAGSRIDALRFITTVKMDQQSKDLEYMTRDSTWDLDLIQYAQNALGAIYGAQTTPRTQTNGERLLAAINSSVSMGIQGGLAIRSTQAGLALGAFNLVTQALLAPR